MRPQRILVTGSRTWTDRVRIEQRLFAWWLENDGPVDAVLVHGGADGADALAAETWEKQGFKTEEHTVSDDQWRWLGPMAGRQRNQRMVDLGADICIAFYHGTPGTADCIARAREAGIPVDVITEATQR